MAIEAGSNLGRVRYEARDVDPRALAYLALGLIVILALTLVFMRVFFFHLAKSQPLGPPPTPFEDVRILPPVPRLQVAPVQDLNEYRRAEQQILNGYGWVDKSNGVTRIPIDRAMDLLLRHGLPIRGQNQQDAAAKPTR
jgi:hypothetical protein